MFGHKHGSNLLANICDSIGQAIENELQMRHYENKAPGLLQTLKTNYWHRATGTTQMIVLRLTLLNRYTVPPRARGLRASRITLAAGPLSCLWSRRGWCATAVRGEGMRPHTDLLPKHEL